MRPPRLPTPPPPPPLPPPPPPLPPTSFHPLPHAGMHTSLAPILTSSFPFLPKITQILTHTPPPGGAPGGPPGERHPHAILRITTTLNTQYEYTTHEWYNPGDAADGMFLRRVYRDGTCGAWMAAVEATEEMEEVNRAWREEQTREVRRGVEEMVRKGEIGRPRVLMRLEWMEVGVGERYHVGSFWRGRGRPGVETGEEREGFRGEWEGHRKGGCGYVGGRCTGEVGVQ
ncbi:hypothetical protein BJ508DRAFT_331964 [Ascobolus immersus RN42]|uniref:Uncharacterized protein n=1 Tax=Ascobolus immersus RN42 TaxID=1160509 RepID=A0A3N4HNZ7_ASCIM|nr:hypothetical protein BJ508DRAFT_331964 [Ascobolus immersus RN42]